MSSHTIKFEMDLKEGQEVEARWTWNHQYFRARATVKKLNKASARVTLLEDVDMIDWIKNEATGKTVLGKTPYQMTGRELVLPLFQALFTQSKSKWSTNNGIFPLPEAAV